MLVVIGVFLLLVHWYYNNNDNDNNNSGDITEEGVGDSRLFSWSVKGLGW